jgi:hypothetical protein
MSATPAKKIERERDNPDGRNRLNRPVHHSYDGEEVCFAMGGDT